MSIFSEIVREILEENVDVKSVNDAIDRKYEVLINYRGEEGEHTGPREIQPVAYGTTKAGFPAIRAFQPNGDTSSRVPSWKMFRLDRIESWKPQPDKVFDQPPGFDQQILGQFNPNGDESMSQVFKVASFGGTNPVGGEPNAVQGPVTKQDVHTGNQATGPNTMPNSTPGERPVQKQYTQGPVTKQDVQAVNQTQDTPEMERLRNKLADEDYVSQAIKDAEYGDEENNEEDIENNG